MSTPDSEEVASLRRQLAEAHAKISCLTAASEIRNNSILQHQHHQCISRNNSHKKGGSTPVTHPIPPLSRTSSRSSSSSTCSSLASASQTVTMRETAEGVRYHQDPSSSTEAQRHHGGDREAASVSQDVADCPLSPSQSVVTGHTLQQQQLELEQHTMQSLLAECRFLRLQVQVMKKRFLPIVAIVSYSLGASVTASSTYDNGGGGGGRGTQGAKISTSSTNETAGSAVSYEITVDYHYYHETYRRMLKMDREAERQRRIHQPLNNNSSNSYTSVQRSSSLRISRANTSGSPLQRALHDNNNNCIITISAPEATAADLTSRAGGVDADEHMRKPSPNENGHDRSDGEAEGGSFHSQSIVSNPTAASTPPRGHEGGDPSHNSSTERNRVSSGTSATWSQQQQSRIRNFNNSHSYSKTSANDHQYQLQRQAPYAIFRTYTEFRYLHDQLTAYIDAQLRSQSYLKRQNSNNSLQRQRREMAPRIEYKEQLPVFPKRKGLFGSTNNDMASIEKRRMDLQLYLRQLLASTTVRESHLMKNFLSPQPDLPLSK